ncbi:MAG: pectin acetylesterase-family hydrolase, partial [Polyangiaceae bacterium]
MQLLNARAVVVGLLPVFFGACDLSTAPPSASIRENIESVATTSSALTSLSLGADGAWTFYDAIPGAKCADGSATGFAINPLSTGNGKLLVFLDGGGFCDDQSSCSGTFKTTTYFSYNASTFATEMTSTASKTEQVNFAPFGSYAWSKTLGTRGLWDRTAAANPFRNYNFVFIPHCTGDMFLGARQDTSSAFPSVRTPSQTWHVGFTNFGVFAQQVQGLFPTPPSIALVGGSAGGVGTLYNYSQLKARYPEVPLTVLSDSGPAFWTGDEGFSPRQGFWMQNFESPGVPSYEEDWFADAFGLDSTHHAGVAAVTRAGAQRSIYPMQNVLLANATESSDTFAFIEGTNDWVTPWYLHLNVNGLSHPNIADAQSDFSANVKLSNVHTLWISNASDPNPNLRVWNQHHGFILDDVSVWTQSGVLPWLTNLFGAGDGSDAGSGGDAADAGTAADAGDGSTTSDAGDDGGASGDAGTASDAGDAGTASDAGDSGSTIDA